MMNDVIEQQDNTILIGDNIDMYCRDNSKELYLLECQFDSGSYKTYQYMWRGIEPQEGDEAVVLTPYSKHAVVKILSVTKVEMASTAMFKHIAFLMSRARMRLIEQRMKEIEKAKAAVAAETKRISKLLSKQNMLKLAEEAGIDTTELKKAEDALKSLESTVPRLT